MAEDATTLLAAGRYPSAASLSILAIEEAGKVSILRELSLAQSETEANAVWKDYRSHTRKNVAWLLPQLAAGGARKLDDFRPLFDKDSDHPHLLDQLKQLGFYTDCLGNENWFVPWEVIRQELATSLVQTAQLFTRDHHCTEREVQLWIEHLGSVWKQDPAWMKQGIINWYASMQAAGLMPEGENAMERFIREGVQTEQTSNEGSK